ncbi:MAG: hypothetical protein R3260_17055, partial [Pseudomonas sp.]|nr:hypothetical protein [Pseudomonas sp.]
NRQSAVGETFRVEGSRLLGADANREIVHFRHTLVKFSKPFFPRSFGVVNLKTRLLWPVFHRRKATFAEAAGRFTVGKSAS